MTLRFRAALAAILTPAALTAATYDIRSYGATGNGASIDSSAINRAISAASSAGGGTVRVPAGTYRCYTLHLRSHVTLFLEAGSTLLAADPAADPTQRYDDPEPNPENFYQDFGHSHWRNSLIVGEDVEDISIAGTGWIDGKGLSDGFPIKESHARGRGALSEAASSPAEASGPFGLPNPSDTLPFGVGNKAVALKHCRNVTLRDVTIYRGGHFGILATGTNNLTIDNLKIDTVRDGMDIDACRNVRISNCSVNSPWDDGICLKSSFALGPGQECSDVTITNCHVSGYDVGALLDGTFRCTDSEEMRRHHGPYGRIKLGTESNGAFRNIAIANCQFDHCLGLALESVDGAQLEDIAVSNLTMRDIGYAPIFIRLAARQRGPAPQPPGGCRRIRISQVVAHRVTAESGVFLTGLPGLPIEDVALSDIFVDYTTDRQNVAPKPTVPELPQDYPEPYRFGRLPSWALFARHIRGLQVHNVDLRPAPGEHRTAVILDDVANDRVEFTAPLSITRR